MWEELLKEVAVIKWGIVCIAVSLWGLTIYFLLKEIPKWWKSFQGGKKKKKPFTLEQMNKDLAKSTRQRRRNWDG
ncbi:hypothetical protein CMI37_34620 [Candidatus Pacearchaeota archaeon]|nr:hypothetical protein [Candidatus Pacearchaeota archaeon]|tara:strand:- start:79 stop:303 length:225 start_codon:yes stop_codon:yes gene_type:complete